MAEPGLVALDLPRLAALEEYLASLEASLRRVAGAVDDALAGTGAQAGAALSGLDAAARWCRVAVDDIRWRRAFVEALPEALPPTARHFEAPGERTAEADRMARRIEVALLAGSVTPPWLAVEGVLRELDRGGHDPAFAAQVLRALGPERARRLGRAIERSYWAGVGPAAPLGPGAALAAAHDVVLRLLAAASRATGPAALDDDWIRDYAGLPADVDLADVALPDASISGPRVDEVVEVLRGVRMGTRLVGALLDGRARAPMVLVSKASGATLLLIDPPAGGEAPARDAVATGLDIAAGVTVVVAGTAATPLGQVALVGGSVALGLAAEVVRRWDLEQAATEEERRRRRSRAKDHADGRATYPSGSPDNPRVDTAGVPYPPGMW